MSFAQTKAEIAEIFADMNSRKDISKEEKKSLFAKVDELNQKLIQLAEAGEEFSYECANKICDNEVDKKGDICECCSYVADWYDAFNKYGNYDGYATYSISSYIDEVLMKNYYEVTRRMSNLCHDNIEIFKIVNPKGDVIYDSEMDCFREMKKIEEVFTNETISRSRGVDDNGKLVYYETNLMEEIKKAEQKYRKNHPYA